MCKHRSLRDYEQIVWIAGQECGARWCLGGLWEFSPNTRGVSSPTLDIPRFMLRLASCDNAPQMSGTGERELYRAVEFGYAGGTRVLSFERIYLESRNTGQGK